MKETKTIKGKVENVVSINTGTTDKGRSWTLFEVLINGQNFRTFDSNYSKEMGKEGEWVFEEEDRVSASGKAYQSRTLLPLSKAKKQEEQERLVAGLGVIRGDIKQLKEELQMKLGQMENLLQAVNIKVSTAKVPERPELKTFRPDVKEKDIPVEGIDF